MPVRILRARDLSYSPAFPAFALVAAVCQNCRSGGGPSHPGRLKSPAAVDRSSKGMNRDLIALTSQPAPEIERAAGLLDRMLVFRPFTQWRDPYPVRVDTQW
ncbi:hypothetical protein ACFV1A_17070 [Streptomyces seoulensis]|uniref:hypothetical protein n=1 Tax=Streptomyces seoulensis TaxID=73044 RepID=UPI0036AF4586